MHDEIVIVSGLPRSGTSLMMQMLAIGGIEVVTDQIREADVDNPRGYYEFEQVKKIKHDKSWLPNTRGKAFKMISQLLYELPSTETFRILFMERDLDETLESQEKMLKRFGNPAAPRGQMKQSFSLHLKKLHGWLDEQSHMQVLRLSYNVLLEHPAASAVEVSRFLDQRPNAETMATAIDASLYRNRAR